MENMQDKLSAMLNDPNTMQQIMSMAQALSQSQPSPAASPPQNQPLPNIDMGTLQKLAGMFSGSGVTQEETSLLQALTPFLHEDRIHRLERAMRAAKMARAASSFLNAGGLQLLGGR